MAPYVKKRKVLDSIASRPQKKFRKQRAYHSSSEDEDDQPTDFQAVSLADSDAEGEAKQSQKKTCSIGESTKKVASKLQKKQEDSSDEEDMASDSAADDSEDLEDDEFDVGAESDASNTASTAGGRTIPKRHDPTAFSNSMAKILATKLPTSMREDPVLSRSKAAAQKSTQVAEEKLDRQARAKMRAEKKEELDRGRIRDVMGLERGQAGAVAEEEKRLRKIAQRGVVKLFNAVRAAQVRGEEAAKAERKKGTIGIGEREKAVNEVSKQGFLDLISGKKGKPLHIEEA
ncbi:rRNA-processing protein RRP15 [Aspergillus saccharolyticus JOP 1030-1]|uniref:Rrp15p-domain-containing protein n=1 Tax=Aspergillus saccharolyticus JOP 1030-1 TaxID=1450539 RepID=A0A318ZDM2_9EURO|nr:Rrp15p-domain-containing protein [Aspergillus saccharolyticus JOP 1030-1]PYH42753.1 Rrp15p-domain-containing protein [Aspergillus saccharolyticus JOP 1030-1]